ncbi:MAG TPA: hypothetical protein VKA21_08655 [Candidatus Binatia bacterium]|nr:hypothetical protein [Candidatus Binatia bacterium]
MTEDFLAVVETKRFLGREFLTWLVHRIEEGDGRVEHDGQTTELQLGDRVVLAGGPDDRARLTVVGEGDVRAELGAGLRRGKLVDRARLILLRGERRWELVLDGGRLGYEALRCPPLGPRDGDRENDLYLRLADVEDALGVLDRLFAEFCLVRASAGWRERALPALRAWVDGLR